VRVAFETLARFALHRRGPALHDGVVVAIAGGFFRMLRSVRSSRFSLRSRASSSRSAVVSPLVGSIAAGVSATTVAPAIKERELD
jgi:hypothetical protein